MASSSSEAGHHAGEPILYPQKFDILSGKDKKCIGHEGSKRFRAIVESYRHQYSLTKTKYEKMQITKEIYQSLNEDSCRFLKYNESVNAWEELSPMHARDKIGHALRFANRPTRRRTKKEAKKGKTMAGRSIAQTEPPSLNSLLWSVNPIPGRAHSWTAHTNQSLTPLEFEDSSRLVCSFPNQRNAPPQPDTPQARHSTHACFPKLPATQRPVEDTNVMSRGGGLYRGRNDLQQFDQEPLQQHEMEDPLMPLLRESLVDFDVDFEISPAIFA